MYFPLTPPPNSEYSPPTVGDDYSLRVSNANRPKMGAHTWAAACVQAGNLPGSVRRLYRSSADATRFALTLTVAVFTFSFFAGLGVGTCGALADVAAASVAEPEGAGVPVRLGSALTVKSLPCVLMRTSGNSANFASKAAGNRFLMTSYRARTAGEAEVTKDQSYCTMR